MPINWCAACVCMRVLNHLLMWIFFYMGRWRASNWMAEQQHPRRESLLHSTFFFRRNDESSRLVAYIQRSHPKVKGAHGPSSSSRVPQLCPCTTAIVPMEKNNNSTEGEKKKRPSSNSCSYECTCRLLKIFSFLLLWDYSLRFFL